MKSASLGKITTVSPGATTHTTTAGAGGDEEKEQKLPRANGLMKNGTNTVADVSMPPPDHISPSTPRALTIPPSSAALSQSQTSKSPLSPSLTPTNPSPSLVHPSDASTSPAAATPPSSSKRVSFPLSTQGPPSAPRTPTTPTAFSSQQAQGGADLLTSSRPAPPSPALSRRTSLARSASSGSRRTSGGGGHASGGSVSGASTGTQSKRTSKVLAGVRHRLSQSVSAADVERLQDMPVDGEEQRPEPLSESPLASTTTIKSTRGRYTIVIRDYAFTEPDDPRFSGQGTDVPRQCDPAILVCRLNGSPCASPSASTHSDDEDDDVVGMGWGSYRQSLDFGFDPGVRASMSMGGGANAEDFARNFGGEEEVDADAEHEQGGGAAGLAPGIYRAQFAFSAEGEAEMSLEEGQLLYVVGHGATVIEGEEQPAEDDQEGPAPAWAVAWERNPPLIRPDLDIMDVHALIGDRSDARQTRPARPSQGERRALVPDSFIVLIRADGEAEEDARTRLEGYMDWMEEERQRQMQEYEAEGGAAEV
ncbi:hypothetical protein MKEN_01319500 [Mycena kentingensis (nom. inval.)]|nr:hypothetical protein MKEN_01319500 [Mycena kentingensis (nom. inval.)]